MGTNIIGRLVAKNAVFSEPADEYHKHSGEYLSSHLLGMYRACPQHYRRHVDGHCERPDSAAYRLGRAAHTLILEGEDALNARYADMADAPINQRTGRAYGADTAAVRDWLRTTGCEDVLSEREREQLSAMQTSVITHPTAPLLLDGATVEHCSRVNRLCGTDIRAQARYDALNSTGDDIALVDLKTTTDLQWFESDARRYGYVQQVVYYSLVLEAAARAAGVELERPIELYIVAVEKSEPYRCGVWALSTETRENMRAVVCDDVLRLARSIRCNDWPTLYEVTRTL